MALGAATELARPAESPRRATRIKSDRSAANSFANSRPIPDEAPVISTTSVGIGALFPGQSRGGFYFLYQNH